MSSEKCLVDANKIIDLLRNEIDTLEIQGEKTIKERLVLMLAISYIKDAMRES